MKPGSFRLCPCTMKVCVVIALLVCCSLLAKGERAPSQLVEQLGEVDHNTVFGDVLPDAGFIGDSSGG